MNNVAALRADGVTGLHGSSGAASQQTGILGEDTARRMRVPGIPLALQPEDAGLQLDATDAISADRQAGLLNVEDRYGPGQRRAHRPTRQTWPVAGSRSEDKEAAMTQLNMNDARCEALFASGLQRSERPTAWAAAEAISRAVRQFGIRGCASRMAQEFGDHPQAAAERMRWARLVVAEMTARSQPSPSRMASLPARYADVARSATRSAVAD